MRNMHYLEREREREREKLKLFQYCDRLPTQITVR